MEKIWQYFLGIIFLSHIVRFPCIRKSSTSGGITASSQDGTIIEMINQINESVYHKYHSVY